LNLGANLVAAWVVAQAFVLDVLGFCG